MATHSASYPGHNLTAADFRAWGERIGLQLAAFGWVQTADAGQINWTTNPAVPGNNVSAGYQIWRMNDALQATLPVFLKLEFGNWASGPQIWVTVGTATDGAGSITGTQQLTRTQITATTTGFTAQTFTCIFSGDASRFTMALWIDHTIAVATAWLTIERSKNASGADDATGIIVAGGSGAGSTAQAPIVCFMQFIPASGGMPNKEGRLPAILSTAGLNSGAFGTTVGMGIPIPLAGSAQNPGKTMLVHLSGDFTRDTQHPVAVYGANHTYYIVGPNIPNLVGVGNAASANNASRLALLYE